MKHPIITFLLILITILILGCRKDYQQMFKVSPEEFIGEWEWKYSVISRSVTDQYGNHLYFEGYDVIYPYEEGRDANYKATIKINKKGTVRFYIDDDEFFKIPANQLQYNDVNIDNIPKYTTNRYSYNPKFQNIREYDFYISIEDTNLALVNNFPFGRSTISYKKSLGYFFNYFERK